MLTPTGKVRRSPPHIRHNGSPARWAMMSHMAASTPLLAKTAPFTQA